MSRSYPLNPRALRSLQIAEVARWWGLTPISLTGKVPTTPNWQHTPYREAVERIRAYATSRPAEVQERMNIGILTGQTDAPTQVVVVDIDKKNGGLERWAKWLAAFAPGGVPETFTVQTGSGGLHIYFRLTPKIADIIKIVAPSFGIDFQTTGGQVVFPGSTNEQGGKYAVLSGIWLDQEGEKHPIFAEMPQWLEQQIRLLREGRAL